MLLIVMLVFVIYEIKGICSDQCNVCSHTTFVARSMSQNSVLELALHDYYQYHIPRCNECPSWLTLELTAPYYFKSTNSKKLAHYFGPQCKDCFSVGQNNESDISSLWLGIASPLANQFQSSVCLRPTRTVIGGAIKLFFDLSAWIDNGSCNNWWASIFIPIQQVRHNLHISETPNTGGQPIVPPSFPNAIAALNNPAWNYGKFSPKSLKRTGVDDICVKLGCDFMRDDINHAGLYGQLFIPTGKARNAQFLFEPTVGSKHVGLGAGFNGDCLLFDCDVNSIDLLVDIRYAYFFSHKELRSIDLLNGDWSRYLLVSQPSNTATPLPGINFFTKEVSITPGSMVEMWTALSFNHCNWHLEVGYDFWYRQKEKISLANQDLGVGIYDIAFNPRISCPVSASCARICQSVPTLSDAPVSDITFVTVKNDENIGTQGVRPGSDCSGIDCSNICSYLNLNSAAHPKAYSSTVYAAISFDDCLCCEYPYMVGFGGQYEFAHGKSALSQYGIWLKTAISF